MLLFILSVKSPTNFAQKLYFRLEILLHAVNLRYRTRGFTSLPKKVILRIFTLRKIHRSRPGLNPRTQDPVAIENLKSTFSNRKICDTTKLYFFPLKNHTKGKGELHQSLLPYVILPWKPWTKMKRNVRIITEAKLTLNCSSQLLNLLTVLLLSYATLCQWILGL